MRTIRRDIVGAFIFSSDNKLLLGKTAPEAGGVYSGQWVVPGGGVEPGETYLQAMQREMLEETQLDVSRYDAVMTDNEAIGESLKSLKETNEQVLVQMTFTDYEIRISKPAEHILAQPTEELVELKWIDISDLADAELSPPTREYLLKHGYIQMTIDKHAAPTKFLWVDLEMTGLDANEDVILEIAAEITDVHFKTVASYEAIVQQPHDIVVDRMQKNIWWKDYPENRDEFVRKTADGKPSAQVEQEMIALLHEHFGTEPAVLAGNSIHNDRNFIKRWWPELDLKLHYRMLDVSAWKVLMQSKLDVQFEKREVHRAYDDIQASIAELQYYLEWFSDHRQD